ncbi:MAG: hypothetical protein N4A41_04370 [Crocinitomicaceae bacterium]|nr:hypothetical protein [Crocinitomicaceae bacterium]
MTAEKCENKSLPEMNCNGRCYLAKQLNLQEEKTTPISKTINVDLWKTADYLCCIQVDPNRYIDPISTDELFDLRAYQLIHEDLESTFHPPCMV